MNLKQLRCFIALSMFTLFATPCPWAAEAPSLSIGAGVSISPGIYKDLDDDKKISPAPLVFANWNRFFIEGLTVGINVIESDRGSIALIAEPGESGYKASDSDALKGMDKRKASFNAGARVMLYSNIGAFALSGAADVTNNSKGETVTASYILPLEFTGFSVTPSIGASWLSKDLTNYYYGVKTKEARADRAAYEAEETVNGFASLDLTCDLTDRITLIGNISGTYLGKEIRNSPLVDEDYAVSGVAGATIKFF